MKTVGLFAGIGGFETGLGRAGHHSIELCEIWEPARKVLGVRFPGIEITHDISALDNLPSETELIAAGFPCQDLSQAGLTAGIKGERSSLVGQVFRLLDKQSVPWVALENVSFMLHLGKGKALETLVSALEERGYRWAYRVVNTLAFLPQRRQRVLFIATNTDVDPSDVLLVDDRPRREQATELDSHAHGFYWTEGVRGLGWAPDAVPTLKNGSTVGIPSPPAILLPSGEIVTPDIRDAERLQGFEIDWTQPAEEVGRASLRWSLIGNAVSVPIAEWLGRRLSDPGIYDTSRDKELPRDGRWPRAARYDGRRRIGVEITGFPCWKDRPPLTDFLSFEGKSLSARATRGFLSRTERSSLRFKAGFKERVRAHLDRMVDDSGELELSSRSLASAA